MVAARAVNHTDDDPDGGLAGPDTVAPLPVSRCRARLCIGASAQRAKDRIFVGEHGPCNSGSAASLDNRTRRAGGGGSDSGAL